MAHIQDIWCGTINNSAWVTINGIIISNSEKYATHVETMSRSENSIPLRTHYGIDASTGMRLGLKSTRIIKSGSRASSHYLKTNILGGILIYQPFVY